MQDRSNYAKAAPDVYQAMLHLHKALHQTSLDKKLIDLVFLRASQINQCAFCIDMHWKDLRKLGFVEQDLYMLDAWREWPGYTDRERAALAWTEALTLLTEGFVTDEVYDEACRHFDEKELAELTLAVVTMNGWNRFNVAFRKPVGGYEAAAGSNE